MSLEEIKNSLTFEINPSLSTNEKTKLASVLIVIFDESPKILMSGGSRGGLNKGLVSYHLADWDVLLLWLEARSGREA